MRRVTERFADKAKGATAVMTALMMLLLLSFGALSVDWGAMVYDKQELQNAADAGALAISQRCGEGACLSGASNADAMGPANKALVQFLAEKNKADGNITARVTVFSQATNTVTVETTTVRNHWFAPLFGVASSPIRAEATGHWGVVSGATTFPLIYSYCEWARATNGGKTDDQSVMYMYMTKDAPAGCTGPNGMAVPGGMGWLKSQVGCKVNTDIGDDAQSDPGTSAPQYCTAGSYSNLAVKVAMVPIFDSVKGTGTNATYHVYGYAAFQVTSYNLPGGNWCTYVDKCGNGRPFFLKGYFLRFLTPDEVRTSADAPSMGLGNVGLDR